MRPKCVTCGLPIPAHFRNTPVHSQSCGHQLLIKLVAAVPGVLDLLPPKWRKDVP